MDSVVHFDFTAAVPERAKKFYINTFGWKFTDLPEMNYSMIYTGEVDSNFMLKEKGRINGGMTLKGEQAKSPVLVINVASVSSALKRIEKNGGTVVMPKTEVGDQGYYARFTDTEGNLMGVWEDR